MAEVKPIMGANSLTAQEIGNYKALFEQGANAKQAKMAGAPQNVVDAIKAGTFQDAIAPVATTTPEPMPVYTPPSTTSKLKKYLPIIIIGGVIIIGIVAVLLIPKRK